MDKHLDRATLESLVADLATGMLDADTERQVRAAIESYPDLAADVAKMSIVRSAFSRSAYNGVIDARAARAVRGLRRPKQRRYKLWIGATAAVAAAAAMYVIVIVPRHTDTDSAEKVDTQVVVQADVVDEINDLLSAEVDDAKIDALVGTSDVEHLVFLTSNDVKYLLDEDNDS